MKKQVGISFPWLNNADLMQMVLIQCNLTHSQVWLWLCVTPAGFSYTEQADSYFHVMSVVAMKVSQASPELWYEHEEGSSQVLWYPTL